jgi:hypothetical protein
MRIACLAWGSLIWKTGPIVLASQWHDDGPRLPVEFARESDGGELATALCPDGVADNATFWALLTTTDLATAREQLRRREQIPIERVDGVGSVPSPAAGPFAARIAAWMSKRPLDAVIWTALPPRSRGVEGRMPSVDEACNYLATLPPSLQPHAEQYVRRVPTILTTRYRAAFEARLGWTPLDTDAALASDVSM